MYRIHTSSHGETQYHRYPFRKMRKWFYSPSPAVYLMASSENGYWSRLLDAPAAAYVISELVISRQWRVDSIKLLWASPTTFNARSPHFFQTMNFYFTYFLHRKHRGGYPPSETSSLSALIAVPVLVIYYILSVLM